MPPGVGAWANCPIAQLLLSVAHVAGWVLAHLGSCGSSVHLARPGRPPGRVSVLALQPAGVGCSAWASEGLQEEGGWEQDTGMCVVHSQGPLIRWSATWG